MLETSSMRLPKDRKFVPKPSYFRLMREKFLSTLLGPRLLVELRQ